MIINTVKASNLLKYASLQLEQIPEQGLIAITGANESGKSSIGESVCFALFGRTFSIDFDELTKLIRWGETHCSVALEFTAGDDRRYRLERFLDRNGNHSARLEPAEASSDEAPLARGIEQVADKLYELIGFEFEEFIESFYLAQREITTPHPHSYAVKTMAGLVTLEYCAEACREDREESLAEVESRRDDLEKLQEQIDELDFDPRRLAEQALERDRIARETGEANRLIQSLDSASIGYQDALPRRERLRQARSRGAVYASILLPLALLAGGSWALLAELPGLWLSLSFSELLGSRLPGWRPELIPWLLYAAGLFTLLFLLVLIQRASLATRLQAQEPVSQALAALLSGLQAAGEEDVADSLEEVTEGAGANPLPEGGGEARDPDQAVDRGARERMSQRVSDWQATLTEVRDGVGREQNLLRHRLERDKLRLGQLEQAVSQEQARLDRGERLQEMQGDLRDKIAEGERHVEICALADELIQGASREVSHQFNRKLRELVSKTLPLFTENRYEHLQIDDDLRVRAFSSEKRDFMDLDEISSGTQRQIMLAVRLALSQELVARAVNGSQFLFLDEPFAFFDEKRTRSALTVLPTLSEELNQIWIIGQAFAEDLKFDLHIRCERGKDAIALTA